MPLGPEELIEYLADILETGKSSITIQKGQTGRRKFIDVYGLSQDTVTRKISNWLEHK